MYCLVSKSSAHMKLSVQGHFQVVQFQSYGKAVISIVAIVAATGRALE